MLPYCKLCERLGQRKIFDTQDDKVGHSKKLEHARAHFLQLQTVSRNEKTTVDTVFDQCFLKEEKSVKKLDCGSLAEFCRTIIKDVPNNNFVSCGECGLELKIRGPNGYLAFDRLLKHARSHLDKKLFFCRHCGYGTTNSNAIGQHIKKAHNFSNQKNHYVDLSKKHQDEIQAILRRCFSGKRLFGKTLSKEEKKMITSNNFLNGNPFLSERHALMLDLIRKYATKSGTLLCRFCSKDISVADKNGAKHCYCPINHALTHLKKPLYRCKRCSKTVTNLPSMIAHLKLHKLTPASREYEDRSEDFHKEILDMLRKCYDAELNTK